MWQSADCIRPTAPTPAEGPHQSGLHQVIRWAQGATRAFSTQRSFVHWSCKMYSAHNCLQDLARFIEPTSLCKYITGSYLEQYVRGVSQHNSNSMDWNFLNKETGKFYKVNTKYKSFNTLNILVVIRLNVTGIMRNKIYFSRQYELNNLCESRKSRLCQRKSTSITKSYENVMCSSFLKASGSSMLPFLSGRYSTAQV